ncbi:hypothetical protein ACN27F_18790 [Solwaraspora sp. WMMB335]|uniref:hypothetical protein n=1 Tax=Solwaraspora sp. WMMB335 TaxID=3404118 RepID=UPI003B948BD5
MSDPQLGPREAAPSVLGGVLLGLAIGVAGDIALWFWMNGGPVVDSLGRARRGYTEQVHLADIQDRFWYGLAFAAAMTLSGAVLVIRRIMSVGVPLLLSAIAGLCFVGLMLHY